MKLGIYVVFLLILISCKKEGVETVNYGHISIFEKGVINSNDTLLSKYFSTRYSEQLENCKYQNNNQIELKAFVNIFSEFIRNQKVNKTIYQEFAKNFPYRATNVVEYLSVQKDLEIKYYNSNIEIDNLNWNFIDSISKRKSNKTSNYDLSCLEKDIDFSDSIKLYGVTKEEENIINTYVYNDIAHKCNYASYGKVYNDECLDSIAKYLLVSKYIELNNMHDGGGYNIKSNISITNSLVITQSDRVKFLVICYFSYNELKAIVYDISDDASFKRLKTIHILTI